MGKTVQFPDNMMSVAIKRDSKIDVLKGFAIILMVAGHALMPAGFYRFISLFHMALFYFASGYLFKDSSCFEHKFQFVKRKFSGLYIPFVKWTLLYLLSLNVLMVFHIVPYSQNITDANWYIKAVKLSLLHMMGGGDLLSGFWFLRSLLFAVILFAMIRCTCYRMLTKVASLKVCHLAYTCAIFLTYFLFWIIQNVGGSQYIFLRDTTAVMILAMGHLFFTFQERIKFYWRLAVPCLLFLLIASMHCKIDFVAGGFHGPLFLFVCSFSGCYLCYYLSAFVSKKESILKSFLSFCGKNSLFILATHLLFFKLVSLLKIYVYHLPLEQLSEHPVIRAYIPEWWWIAYTVIGVAGPLCFLKIFNHIKQFLTE